MSQRSSPATQGSSLSDPSDAELWEQVPFWGGRSCGDAGPLPLVSSRTVPDSGAEEGSSGGW